MAERLWIATFLKGNEDPLIPLKCRHVKLKGLLPSPARLNAMNQHSSNLTCFPPLQRF
jgi:hypothetical protein